MKKIILLFAFIGILSSCASDDDNENSQLTMTELLTQNSPWNFSHYEMVNIVDSGSSNFTKIDIENNVNSKENGVVWVFNQDGTGSVSKEDEYFNDWNWEIINDNQLKLTLAIFPSSSTREIISISATQLVTKAQIITYDESANTMVTHNGYFYFE